MAARFKQLPPEDKEEFFALVREENISIEDEEPATTSNSSQTGKKSFIQTLLSIKIEGMPSTGQQI